ncbi:MAG: bifunctional 23S rRNA (guanine(2069)-N(7))-methyltransferase RlmK/23S rRNA (guanine(2445)-N(2))-methyltransferase RlmL [Phycisphaerales bacterium]|nr:bifunctional 23S rRNA (guanine(2069)-N(7))-methyltransferase RlmK/23S rRNA (guanine(2445)-N(2))-methyltransferase RlmL [Phycisphaerales bacterium]
MSGELDIIATSAFGLEAVVARELEQLGYQPKIISTGRVLFRGTARDVARANVRLRAADRVLVRVASFPADNFDALFDRTKDLPWERWIPRDGAFPVNGRSVKSQLSSVPACQRTVKKAIVERLMRGHATRDLPETGVRTIIEVAILENIASITLDTSGDGLHKRGYRDIVGDAALKETMAAGLVLLSVWNADRPLVDPFCGTGTIVIEAAMIGLGLAPGRSRSFDAENWAWIGKDVFDDERAAGNVATREKLAYTIHGSDVSETALALARRHAERAGVARHIHFQKRAFADLQSKAEYGCIVTNPPYGERMGEDEAIERLYRSFPDVLRRLPTWSHHILTARLDLEQLVGQPATRRRKLFNAQIECTYYQFLGPRPERRDARDGVCESPDPDAAASERNSAGGESIGVGAPPESAASWDAGEPTSVAASENGSNEFAAGSIATGHELLTRAPREHTPAMPAFGGLRERDRRELDEFEGRLAKRVRHLRRWPDKGITCYRIYERDCPDVPVTIDRYEGHAHIFEYEREHGRTLAQHIEWIDDIARRTARVLGIDEANVHAKSRPRQKGLTQHEKLDAQGTTLVANEGGLRFEVNLTDYADTGLFLDHRITRGMVREMSGGKRVLNLFCYTGSFTVYAAAGGAKETTSVDLSNTYLDWAERNLRLNGLDGPRHRFVRSDVMEFLRGHKPGRHYDIAIVDPPTFSNSKSTEQDWDVQKAHVELLTRVGGLMASGGVVFFSNNSRRFKIDEAALAEVFEIREISQRTVPEDFRNERIHRCWRMVVR